MLASLRPRATALHLTPLRPSPVQVRFRTYAHFDDPDLNLNPRYPPKDGLEFAEKYLAGFYTYVEVRKAPKKAQIFAAVERCEATHKLLNDGEKHIIGQRRPRDFRGRVADIRRLGRERR